MRKLAIGVALIVLTGCGQSEEPVFTRQAGMWQSEVQMPNLAEAMVTPQMRAEMDPAAFAAMQAQANRRHQVNAPRCVGEEEIYAADLYNAGNTGGLAAEACNLAETTRTETNVVMEGACEIGGTPSQMRVETEYSPIRVSTTITTRYDATAEMPNPPEIRMQVTETRIGDCPAEAN